MTSEKEINTVGSEESKEISNSTDKYQYTNKSIVYDFDLSQLSPAERAKFDKLTDRQKRKLIQLLEINKEGSMKHTTALRPVYFDDKVNERENSIRTIQSKIETVDSILSILSKNKMENVPMTQLRDAAQKGEASVKDLKDEILSNTSIPFSDINKVTKINPNASYTTLKKYYEALINDLKSEGDDFKVNRALMTGAKNLNSLKSFPNLNQRLAKADDAQLAPLFKDMRDLIESALQNYDLIGKPIRKLNAEEVVRQTQVNEDMANLKEALPKVFNEQMTTVLDNYDSLKKFSEELDAYIQTVQPFPSNARKELEYSDIVLSKETIPKDVFKELKKFLKNISEGDSPKQMKFDKVFKALEQEMGVARYPYDVPRSGYYDYIKQLYSNYMNNVFTEIPNDIPLQGTSDKRILPRTVAFTQALASIGKLNYEYNNAIYQYLDKQSKDFTSGSIKQRIFDIFRRKKPSAEPARDEGKELKEELSENLNKLRNEIKEELLKQANEIKELKERLQNEAKTVPAQPEKNSTPARSNDFLDAIRNKPKLNKVDNSKIETKLRDDSESDPFLSSLQRVMEKRREDISPDSDDNDYSDSEDWLGSGILKRMSLEDYLKSLK